MGLATVAHAQDAIVGPARITDGDTITVFAPYPVRVRLHGIDAPELRQTCATAEAVPYSCGQAAASILSDIIGGSVVACYVIEIDRHRRAVAKCFTGGRDLSGEMVASGWAVAYRHYSNDYVAAEAIAKERKLGLWNGSFEDPASWRKHKPL